MRNGPLSGRRLRHWSNEREIPASPQARVAPKLRSVIETSAATRQVRGSQFSVRQGLQRWLVQLGVRQQPRELDVLLLELFQPATSDAVMPACLAFQL